MDVQECQKALDIEAMASPPKGKPSPEVKAKMDEQKAARSAFCQEIRDKYGFDAKVGDKKIVKDLLAAAEAVQAAAAAADSISLRPPSGTRDFYPDDMRLQSWLFEQFRAVAHEMAFQVHCVRPEVQHVLTVVFPCRSTMLLFLRQRNSTRGRLVKRSPNRCTTSLIKITAKSHCVQR